MNIKNFLTSELEPAGSMHDGIGTLKHVSLFANSEFTTNIRFINYTILPPGTSIGLHEHGDDEEMYIILEGDGIMTVDGEQREVHAGDIVINRPFGTHGLENNSHAELKILVMEVYN
jgi:mannose-6-phosphate isomerase-like protein (cupin superfamily)